MAKLTDSDLSFLVTRLPLKLKQFLKSAPGKNVKVGGGYIRSVITNEKVNDIDLFISPNDVGNLDFIVYSLHTNNIPPIKTENAITLREPTPIQIIHRWHFDTLEATADSFDFTICQAAFHFNGEKWDSYCSDTYYSDLAAKRLVYTSPKRIEEVGGSLLRVLKYYQKGFRIPIDSLAKVTARFISELDFDKVNIKNEAEVAKVLTGLLRVVDPNIDPLHEAHLPKMDKTIDDQSQE